MWRLLSGKTQLSVVAAGVVLVAVCRILISPPASYSVLQFAELLLSSGGIAAIIAGVVGRMRWAWWLPCLLGLRRWYPDLNGEWVGSVESSFLDGSGSAPIQVRMSITQTWAAITVETRSTDGNHESEAETAEPTRERGTAVLWMHFIGRQRAPAPTDEREFFGASRLVHDKYVGNLNGTYWTDRGAHILHSGGTAGRIVLTRQDIKI
jgi:hypothetical protein